MVNLKKIKKIHFTGIKGVGMTALALCARDLGLKISGSDVRERFVTDEILAKNKINYQIGFKKENIGRPDLLIFTGAHGGQDNPEVIYAQNKNIPVMSHAQALGLFMKAKEGISVCGVGGKTTTAAMLATVLTKNCLKPSYAIGVGAVKPLGEPGRFEKESRYFIAEADEYAASPQDRQPRFNYQYPKIIILTNLEFDHPDFYPNFEATLESFKNFIQRIPKDGLLVACFDNPRVVKLLQKVNVPYQSYGFSSKADWQIIKMRIDQQRITFKVKYKNLNFEDLTIFVPGKFNVLNATAVLVTSYFLGLNLPQIKEGLAFFQGTKRRFEFIGKIKDVFLYDDYAHHPAEIKATLEAIKNWWPHRRLIVIFQPHTYSRTKYLLTDFSQSFRFADEIIITDVYASAREKDDLGVSGEVLTAAIVNMGKKAYYLPNCEVVCQFLKKITRQGDVIFTLGAGNIFLWHEKIIKSLKTINF